MANETNFSNNLYPNQIPYEPNKPHEVSESTETTEHKKHVTTGKNPFAFQAPPPEPRKQEQVQQEVPVQETPEPEYKYEQEEPIQQEEPIPDSTPNNEEKVKENTNNTVSDLKEKIMSLFVHSEKPFDPEDIQKNKIYAIIMAICPVLFFFPFILGEPLRSSPFGKKYATQSLFILVFFLIRAVIDAVFKSIPLLGGLLSFVYFVIIMAYYILNIVFAVQGSDMKLPIIGDINIKIFKD